MKTTNALASARERTLLVLVGPPLTGKSTLSRALGSALRSQWIDVDEVRKEIYHEEGGAILTVEEEHARMRVAYQEMYRRAVDVLGTQTTVIVNATHSRQYHHEYARNGARQAQAGLVVISPDFEKIGDVREFLEARLKSRRDRGDTSSNIKQVEDLYYVGENFESYQAIGQEGVAGTILVNPNRPVAELVEHIISELAVLLTESKRD